jgi:hypothetical protein
LPQRSGFAILPPVKSNAVKKYLASIGAKGGSVKSEAKRLAARENAKKPRKKQWTGKKS